MKNFLLAMIMALVVAFSVNICSAYHQNNHYPNDPFDYNPDYRYLCSVMDYTNIYLYLPSVDVQEYNPPHYQIRGMSVGYSNSRDKTYDYGYRSIRYNWYTKEAFHRNENDTWIRIGTGTDNASTNNRRFADALFRAAYSIDFYGY